VEPQLGASQTGWLEIQYRVLIKNVCDVYLGCNGTLMWIREIHKDEVKSAADLGGRFSWPWAL
jgi:hypothetical protein